MLKTELFAYFSKEDEKGREHRCTIAVVLVNENVENPQESIFAIGESVCSHKDNFKKSVGKAIALGRAQHEECEYADIFKLSDAMLLEKYEDGPVVDGVIQPQSSVVSPMTMTPIPFGITNRLLGLLAANAPTS